MRIDKLYRVALDLREYIASDVYDVYPPVHVLDIECSRPTIREAKPMFRTS